MTSAVPSPSPRTLRMVGGVRVLALPGQGGPVRHLGLDNFGEHRVAPSESQQLRAGLLRWLLAIGHFRDASDAL